MKVILTYILPLSLIFGFSLLYNLADILIFRRKSDKKVFRIFHALKTPLSVAATVAIAVILIMGKATMTEMLIALLAMLVTAFL